MAGNFEAVIFDMDGTLVEQLIDFAAIRREIGISPRNGILEAIQQMPPAEAERAEQMLLAREVEAARRAQLIPGATEIVGMITEAGLKTALLTRNAQQAMGIVTARFCLAFDLAWSREDGPIKPAPDGILRACRQLGVGPEQTCCVGDFRYDIVAAKAAGATSVLLAAEGRPHFADEADYVIGELSQLAEILGI